MSSELKDFVSAFGMGMRLSDSWELAKDRRERRKRRDALDPNKSPEVQGVEDAYKQSGGTGSLGAVPVDQTGYTEGYGSDGTIMNYGEGYREGGIVRDTEQEAEADSAANQRDNPTRHGYMAEELGGTSGEMPQYRSRSKRRAMDVVPDIMQRDSTDFNRKFREGYREGGLVIDNPAYLRGRQVGEQADRDERGIPDLPPRMDYDENGQPEGWGSTGQRDVPWIEPPVPLPPRQQTEIDGAPMTLSQDRLPPISDYPAAGRPVTPTGNSRGVLPVGGGRKATSDQTRVEAYDPGLDGPGLTGGASTSAAPPPDGGAPTVSAPKAGGSPQVPYNPTAGGEGSSANAKDDLQKAIDGGLQFATDAFHLKGDGAALPGTERNQQRGMQALAKGVGAADPQLVQALDQRVNQIPGMKNDPGLWAIRRLEAIYRFYSRTGQSEKANKAVFELMQYSAGVAAKHGDAALQMLKGGDQQGAIQQIVQGHNMIPDGRRLQVDGNKVMVLDSRTGEQVQTYQIKPQDVFNAALGLSDRSLYWDVLMHRAASTQKGRGTQRSESQIELDKARTENVKARTAKLKAGGGGGGGGGTSPALQQFIDKVGAIDASRGTAPASPPGQSGARPANSDGQGGGETDGDGDDEEGRGGAQPANAGGQGGGEGRTHDGYPVRKNADGSSSSELSITVTNPRLNGGRPTNIPSLWAGKEVDEETAVSNALKSGRQFQSFGSIDEAVSAASARSNAGGANAPGAQESVMRLKPRPGRVASAVETPTPQGASSPSGAPAKFDPEGDGYDYETARAAGLAPDETGHWPSRDPRTGVLLKGRQHPTSKLGDEADAKKGFYTRKREDGRYESFNPDEAPDVEVFRDGSKYAPAAREGQPTPFDRPKPGANPYRPLLADVAKIPGKEGVRARQLLTAKIAAYDKEAGSWDKDRKEHDTNERRRVKEEGVRAREDQKAKMRDAYDFKPRPAERKQLMEEIDGAVQGAIKKVTDKKADPAATIFGAVDDGKLKNLALEVMTSNPLPDANRALAIIENMTLGSDVEGERKYKPRGRDVLGNIVVETELGPVHLRPQAFKEIATIARERNAAAVAKKNAPPEESGVERISKKKGEVAAAVGRATGLPVRRGTPEYDATTALETEVGKQKDQIQQRNRPAPKGASSWFEPRR
jgi:hypothetical protein